MDPGVRSHRMKANPTGYQWLSDKWLSRYGLLEDFTASVTGTGKTEVTIYNSSLHFVQSS